MPTIPDDRAPDFDSPSFHDDPESDSRCKLGQNDRDSFDLGETTEVALLPGTLPANRELSITELLRYPTLLSEDTTLGMAAKLFACGMDEPAVLVTHANRPLGILEPTTVLRLIRGRTVEEIEQTRVLDVITPSMRQLEAEASLMEAAELFVAEDRDALIVVNRDGVLAGVLLARDLCLLCV